MRAGGIVSTRGARRRREETTRGDDEGTTRGRLGKSARMDGLFPRMEIRLSRTRATTERSTERLTMRARVRFSRAG